MRRLSHLGETLVQRWTGSNVVSLGIEKTYTENARRILQRNGNMLEKVAN